MKNMKRGRYRKDHKLILSNGLEQSMNDFTLFMNDIHFFNESLAKYSRVHFIFEGRKEKAEKEAIQNELYNRLF